MECFKCGTVDYVGFERNSLREVCEGCVPERLFVPADKIDEHIEHYFPEIVGQLGKVISMRPNYDTILYVHRYMTKYRKKSLSSALVEIVSKYSELDNLDSVEVVSKKEIKKNASRRDMLAIKDKEVLSLTVTENPKTVVEPEPEPEPDNDDNGDVLII